MQDLLAFLVIVIVAVGGAEFVRAVCTRSLSAPKRLRSPEPEPTRVAALQD